MQSNVVFILGFILLIATASTMLFCRTSNNTVCINNMYGYLFRTGFCLSHVSPVIKITTILLLQQYFLHFIS